MGVLGVVGVIMLGFAVAGGGVWPRVGWALCGVGFVGVVIGVVACPLSRAVSSLRIDVSGLKRWSGRHVSRASEVTEKQI
ncbi:hypothetical protein BFS79_00625 [Cutibacterium avidum]|nr:hypothetical protein BFS79_00625 [Cutibacterium avidum]